MPTYRGSLVEVKLYQNIYSEIQFYAPLKLYIYVYCDMGPRTIEIHHNVHVYQNVWRKSTIHVTQAAAITSTELVAAI